MHRKKRNPFESHADTTNDSHEMGKQEPLPKGESDLVMDNDINIEDIDDCPDESNSI